MNVAEWQGAAINSAARFFSLGRHALAEALRTAGIEAGDPVLLPEFICRDVLASLHSVRAKPVWYPVGADLRPRQPPEEWPNARALVAVNYFGFPQPMQPFRGYAARTGAVVIEDNSHGLFSRDDDGRWLGTRADFGIFSLRKSLPISDGAMLVVSDRDRTAGRLVPQEPEAGSGFAPTVVLKAHLRSIPLLGAFAMRASTWLARLVRRMRTGHAIAQSDLASEREIPWPAMPHLGLSADLARVNAEAEISRRRALYVEVEALARTEKIDPVFSVLPSATCPYGFPFRADDAAAGKLKRWADARGLELIRWPDLPSAVAARAADNAPVWLVNFL